MHTFSHFVSPVSFSTFSLPLLSPFSIVMLLKKGGKRISFFFLSRPKGGGGRKKNFELCQRQRRREEERSEKLCVEWNEVRSIIQKANK